MHLAGLFGAQPIPTSLGNQEFISKTSPWPSSPNIWIIAFMSYRKLRVLVQTPCEYVNVAGINVLRYFRAQINLVNISLWYFCWKQDIFSWKRPWTWIEGFFTACFIHALGVLVSAGPSKLSSTQNSTLTSRKTARGTYVFLLLWSGWKITCSSLRIGAYQHLRKSLLHRSQGKCLAACGFTVTTSTTR